MKVEGGTPTEAGRSLPTPQFGRTAPLQPEELSRPELQSLPGTLRSDRAGSGLHLLHQLLLAPQCAADCVLGSLCLRKGNSFCLPESALIGSPLDLRRPLFTFFFNFIFFNLHPT